MSGPQRKGSAPAEATQALQALDIVDVVEIAPPEPRAGGIPSPRRMAISNPSIAPVGLDLAPARGGADDEANATMQVRALAPLRRRQLKGIVIGAVAGCLVILLAAGIARIGHASSETQAPSVAAAPATATAVTPVTAAAPAPSPSPAAAPASTAAGAAATSLPSTGTVRLGRPAVPGRVWLDGKKLTSASALVSCGTHQVKVGFKRSHSIDVPCGGEVGVSK